MKNTSSDPFAATWNVAERFFYDPYGTATIFSSTYGSQSSGTHQWQHLHQGLRRQGGFISTVDVSLRFARLLRARLF